jgi:hypothetical protein
MSYASLMRQFARDYDGVTLELDVSVRRCQTPSPMSHLTHGSPQGMPIESYASVATCRNHALTEHCVTLLDPLGIQEDVGVLQVISRTGVGYTKTSKDLSMSTLLNSHSLTSPSCSGESEMDAMRIRQYTPSVSCKDSRRSAFVEFSRRETRERGNVPQAQSSSSMTRTYALLEERTARFVSTGASAAITHMADQLCGEDPRGPTLPEAEHRTADIVLTGLTPPAVASEVAELLAQAPYALKPTLAASVAAAATMHAGVQAPACLLLTQDAATEHTREQELHEAWPRSPLRFQGGSTCAEVAEFPENIAENSVEDRDTLHGLDSAGVAYGHYALPSFGGQCDTILRKQVPRRSSEDWTSTLPQVSSSAEEDTPCGVTLPENLAQVHTPPMTTFSTAASASTAAMPTMSMEEQNHYVLSRSGPKLPSTSARRNCQGLRPRFRYASRTQCQKSTSSTRSTSKGRPAFEDLRLYGASVRRSHRPPLLRLKSH